MKPAFQATTAPTQEPHGDADVAHQPFRLGDPLPLRCLPEHLQAIFQIGPSRFYALVKAGRFDRFELRPRIGRRAWSGKLLQRYLDQEGSSSRFVKSA